MNITWLTLKLQSNALSGQQLDYSKSFVYNYMLIVCNIMVMYIYESIVFLTFLL